MHSLEMISLIVGVASVIINLVMVLTSRKYSRYIIFDFDEAAHLSASWSQYAEATVLCND